MKGVAKRTDPLFIIAEYIQDSDALQICMEN
jgi:hypothetical protein